MITTKGTILLNDGVTSVVNPLINVYTVGASKFIKTSGVAQYGRVVKQGEGETATEYFQQVGNLGGESGEWNTGDIADPKFTDVQNAVLKGLVEKYPDCTFTVL